MQFKTEQPLKSMKSIPLNSPKTMPAKKVPAGWDSETYANFKKANPNIEPDLEDTARMLSSNPAVSKTTNYTPNLALASQGKPAYGAMNKAIQQRQNKTSAPTQGPDRPSMLRGFLKNLKDSADKNLNLSWENIKKVPTRVKSMIKGNVEGLK